MHNITFQQSYSKIVVNRICLSKLIRYTCKTNFKARQRPLYFMQKYGRSQHKGWKYIDITPRAGKGQRLRAMYMSGIQ